MVKLSLAAASASDEGPARVLFFVGPAELRVVDYLGPYTLYAYDPDSPHGRMDLRLSSFHGKHELRPTFRVEHEYDPDWLDYFYDQFMQIWNAGERVTPRP